MVSLEPITVDNFEECIRLTLTEPQRVYCIQRLQPLRSLCADQSRAVYSHALCHLP